MLYFTNCELYLFLVRDCYRANVIGGWFGACLQFSVNRYNKGIIPRNADLVSLEMVDCHSPQEGWIELVEGFVELNRADVIALGLFTDSYL